MVSMSAVSRIFSNYGKLIFDPKYMETIEKSIKCSSTLAKDAGKSKFYQFDKQIKDGFLKAESATKDTTLWNGIKKSVTSLPSDMTEAWKSNTGFLNKLKSSAKQLGGRLPLFLSIFTVVTELPNIWDATKDKGLGGGISETLKTAGRLGVCTALGAITQAVCPIPLAGGVVGWMAGDWIFSKFFGERYETQKEELAEKQKQTEQNLLTQQNIQQPYLNTNPQLQPSLTAQDQIQQQNEVPRLNTFNYNFGISPYNYGQFQNYGMNQNLQPYQSNGSLYNMMQLMQMQQSMNHDSYSDDIMFNRLNMMG